MERDVVRGDVGRHAEVVLLGDLVRDAEDGEAVKVKGDLWA